MPVVQSQQCMSSTMAMSESAKQWIQVLLDVAITLAVYEFLKGFGYQM